MSMTTDPERYRFTVDDFTRLAEAGLFAPDERVELIDGEIFKVSPQNPPHASVTNRLATMLIRAASDDVTVRVQSPAVIGKYSQLEPDVLVARASGDGYATAHPTVEDVLVAVEVSDASYVFDRNKKLAVYATEGVAALWIVDVRRGRVETFSDPVAGAYQSERTAERSETVTVPGTDVTLRVEDVLPPQIR